METTLESRRLGEEKISKLLLEFCIPCIMGLLISAFYNIVDQIFIGNSELGYLGNAATGVSFLLICIANAGSCVIVGRTADHILKDVDGVKSIFIYAPREYRVRNVMEMYNDSYASALANVRHSDISRSAYYRNISGKNWNDPHNYDLCIDASCGVDKCVEIITNYLKDDLD